jgi:hypothetical protein
MTRSNEIRHDTNWFWIVCNTTWTLYSFTTQVFASFLPFIHPLVESWSVSIPISILEPLNESAVVSGDKVSDFMLATVRSGTEICSHTCAYTGCMCSGMVRSQEMSVGGVSFSVYSIRRVLTDTTVNHIVDPKREATAASGLEKEMDVQISGMGLQAQNTSMNRARNVILRRL